MARRGEPGYATALSAPTWGYYDALNHGRPFTLPRPFGSYVIENVLFKVPYPAEFHAQTAVEAAVRLHPQVQGRLDEIDRIQVETQEAAMRIIDKQGPLRNPADRDHCLQYMIAVPLIRGTLSADDYEEEAARDPWIDRLRAKMEVVEEPRYSHDYLDPGKRSIANAIQIFFNDGRYTERVEVEYPLGHPRRRSEAIDPLWSKFERSLAARFPPARIKPILERFKQPDGIANAMVHEFMAMFAL